MRRWLCACGGRRWGVWRWGITAGSFYIVPPVPQRPEPFRQGILPGLGLGRGLVDSGCGNVQGALRFTRQQPSESA